MDTTSAIRFEHVRLQNFRNIEFVDLPVASNKVFFLGKNGQGKSNLLEALGLVTALKSFRTADLKPLIRTETEGAAAWYQLTRENADASTQNSTTLEIRLNARGGKQVLSEGEPLKRIRNLLGRYPTVFFASDDIQLLRGGPGERRRWIDLLLSVTDAEYFHALVDYHRCLSERNRLLKRGGSSAEFNAFESTLAGPAVTITRKRREALVRLSPILADCHAEISRGNDRASISLRSDEAEETLDLYQHRLADWRERDRLVGTTRHGPHRDDLELRIDDEAARVYGSDGQQRSLVLALRMAQAKHIRETLHCGPVLLADDIIGELDGERRLGFWRLAADGDLQVIATGTELPPDPDEWTIWQVEKGQFHARP